MAVQSHWFSVGSIVSWALPGVGAVATQSIAEPAYGPRLLDRLRGGRVAEQRAGRRCWPPTSRPASARLRSSMPGASRGPYRDGCIPHAGHVEGDGFSVQANMMASPEVWPAMAEAFGAADGPLARRLLAALEAAEAAGGDVRGRQSAALLVVPATGESGRRWPTCGSRTIPSPSSSCGGCSTCATPTRWRRRVTTWSARDSTPRPPSVTGARPSLSRTATSCCFGPASGSPREATSAEGAGYVRRAIELHPGWRELLARLDPEIAPGAEPVREALGVRTSEG